MPQNKRGLPFRLVQRLSDRPPTSQQYRKVKDLTRFGLFFTKIEIVRVE